MIASGRLAPLPGQGAPGRGAGSPGYMGQDAPGNRAKGSPLIENEEFHLELNYILYLPVATKSRILGNSGSVSGSGV